MDAGECLKHEWMREPSSSGESEEDDDVDSLPATKSDKPKVCLIDSYFTLRTNPNSPSSCCYGPHAQDLTAFPSYCCYVPHALVTVAMTHMLRI